MALWRFPECHTALLCSRAQALRTSTPTEQHRPPSHAAAQASVCVFVCLFMLTLSVVGGSLGSLLKLGVLSAEFTGTRVKTGYIVLTAVDPLGERFLWLLCERWPVVATQHSVLVALGASCTLVVTELLPRLR
jgi:hypothetical protein